MDRLAGHAKVNPVLNASTSYTDNSVQSGTTYYYVSTAVDRSGIESMYSNQRQAVIPSPWDWQVTIPVPVPT